ncbi:MAG: hypothetical protein RAO92_09405 [Candidatus Euphemobacter frigidus]|nr:hypothetical protein [Candidatus Euphemobacter frigidus]MDP8276598.1 hypothetical protein [Candidatus Euphemobacter frigidus]
MTLYVFYYKARTGLPLLALLAVFSILALRINFILPVPKLFFLIHLPTFDLFRKWIHFFPLVNFSLSALAAVGFAAVLRFCQGRSTGIFCLLVSVPLFLQVADLTAYDRKYVSEFRDNTRPTNMEKNFFNRTDYAGVHWF